MPSPLPVDRVEYRRLLWQSRLGTVALSVPFLAGVPLLSGPAGALVLLVLALYALAAGWALVRLWRRSFAARPVVLPLDATHAERVGVPGLDDPAGRHRGLSGQEELPRRW